MSYPGFDLPAAAQRAKEDEPGEWLVGSGILTMELRRRPGNRQARRFTSWYSAETFLRLPAYYGM